MQNKPILIIFMLAGLFNIFQLSAQTDEKKAIKDLIETAYFNGAYNACDIKAMANGFHSEFAITYVENDTLQKYPIADWIKGIENRKAKPNFDATKKDWEGIIKEIDVTGEVAVAKVELSKKGELVYTDYLSLCKFKNGWKIVGKVYSQHE